MKSNLARFGRSIESITILLPKWVGVIMITGAAVLLGYLPSTAQEYSPEVKVKSIAPYPIYVGYNKTSNLIFPYAIISVDRGGKEVLVQKAKGIENILQVKAGKEGFAESNLSVVTADGQFYSFLVNYEADPAVLNLSFCKDSIMQPSNAFLSESLVNAAVLEQTALQVKENASFLHLHTTEQKMRLSLSGIYLKGNMMLFSLLFKNKSLIDFTPDYVRFFVRGKKRAKRTAIQEKEIRPLYSGQDTSIIGGKTDQRVVVFVPFTISKTKELVIQVGEKDGGRSLLLRVRHRAILKARLLH